MLQLHWCCVLTDRAAVHPRPQPKSALTDFGLQPFSHTQPYFAVIMVSTPVIHINIMNYLLTYRTSRDGRLSWTSWLTHYRQFTHLSTIDEEKCASQKPTC